MVFSKNFLRGGFILGDVGNMESILQAGETGRRKGSRKRIGSGTGAVAI
jgi:hypothetical protein